MTKLETITAEDLQNRTYEPTPFLVDELIPDGFRRSTGRCAAHDGTTPVLRRAGA